MGTKDGVSLHDSYGMTHTKVQAYLARHPIAGFDEIEVQISQRCLVKHSIRKILIAWIPESYLFFVYRFIRRNRRLFLMIMLQINMLEKNSDG